MITLYDIQSSKASIIQELEHTEDDALRAALFEQLDAIEESLDQKLMDYCAVIKDLRASSLAFDSEISRLKDKKEGIDKNIQEIENRLEFLLPQKLEWKMGVHKISWRKSSSVIVKDESLIPPAYLKSKTTVTPDKKQIGDDLKLGATIPGCELQTNMNIQIK